MRRSLVGRPLTEKQKKTLLELLRRTEEGRPLYFINARVRSGLRRRGLTEFSPTLYHEALTQLGWLVALGLREER